MIKSTLFFLVCWLMITPCWGQSGHTAKLIEEAKREMEVVIYGTMDLRVANLLNDKFREKYPFLDVKFNSFGSGNLVPRTLAEVRAGRHLSDILQTNSLGLHFLRKEGVLGHYVSPEDRFYPKEFKDQGYWTTTNMNVHVLAYNTKLMTRERLPRTYEDLLNPVWRGKMVLDASEQWFALMVQIMGKDKGLKYIAALAKQNVLLRRESSAMRAQLIAAGEADGYRFNAWSCGSIEKTRPSIGLRWVRCPLLRAPMGLLLDHCIPTPPGYTWISCSPRRVNGSSSILGDKLQGQTCCANKRASRICN